MDKNSIKKYAVWARRELISRVSQKAQQFGITEKNIVDASAVSVNGHLLSADEKKQRQALIAQIKQNGYEQVMEEIAYTWFNRFIALRFMEVNGYLPTHVRVFTDEQNSFKPQILAEAIHLELDGLNMDKVYALKDVNNDEALYKYLLITQCNALSAILPGMFQRIDDYTELLFPDNLLRDGSALEQMVTLIPEADWQDQVQIIGWLYQYYNTEPKDKVFTDLKKNIKISKENIPAATQLFTPDWIVRYMVENSLGRLWLEHLRAESEIMHPIDSPKHTPQNPNSYLYADRKIADLKSNWKYYLDEAEQTEAVEWKLRIARQAFEDTKPEDIRCIDPCMGSGHILVYMFDVLMQIYESYGYTARDAVRSIVENNLYGLDIDDRAAQLAYFAVMMKARQYDSRFFSRGIQPHVHPIMETNALGGSYKLAMGDFLLSKEHQETLNYLLDAFIDAKEYGSILQLENRDYQGLLEAWKYTASQTAGNFNLTLWFAAVEHEIPKLIEQAIILTQQYDVVVTNPPYMGSSGMSAKLGEYVKKEYPDSKSDLFAVFIERCGKMTGMNRYQAMITQHAWMFLSSFEKLRTKLLQKDTVNMAHLGARAFDEIGGEVVQTTSFVMQNSHISGYKGVYCRLIEPTTQQGKEDMFLACENRFESSQDNFSKIPGSPVAYWVGKSIYELFSKDSIGNHFDVKAGMCTGENATFILNWQEIDWEKCSLVSPDEYLYTPHNKGGEFRKWYGNKELVLKYNTVALAEMAQKAGFRHDGKEYYFRAHIGWSKITSYKTSFRLFEEGYTFDSAGLGLFPVKSENLYTTLALLNSNICEYLLGILNPTLNVTPMIVKLLPYDMVTATENIVKKNISLSRTDWDSLETSWDFLCHPLIGSYATVADAYANWEQECTTRFNTLKANEEELNRIFIDIYGLQDELTPEVEDKDVTVRLADKKRDIRSLISYAVGCMFGRYSLDVDGLAYAGGEWDASKYKSYPADRDNVIPICDDEYFDDDIVGRFVKFIETVYGRETLEKNLRFIADALGGSGQPREVIRNYFLNDFYADHLKIYQKRPIYWLFDSGKKNGFKALIYMHRYQPDTIARMRTDYVHEQQARYRTAIADLGHRIENAATTERVKLNKQLIKLQEQAEELRIYEEKIHHLADQMIHIDLDDGVKRNYEIFGDVLAKIK